MSEPTSTPPTKITDEHVDELFVQLRSDIHNSDIGQERFQKLIRLEVNKKVVTLLVYIADGIGHSLVVPVDYDEPNAIVNAINTIAGFPSYHITLQVDVADIPVGGTGWKKHEVFEFRPNDRFTYLPELHSHGLKFADPLTMLRYAKLGGRELYDRHSSNNTYLVAYFTNSKGESCYLRLTPAICGEFNVKVGPKHLDSPDWHWDRWLIIIP